MEKYLIDYLSHIGSDRFDYKYEMVPCEVCGKESFTIIRDTINIGKGSYGKCPVQSCNYCGFIMQNPRFEKKFYQDYYRKYYRNMTHGNKAAPNREFLDNQIQRSRNLIAFLSEYIPARGAVLDVGASSGGFLIPFQEMGWEVRGNDPDSAYVEYGAKELKVPLDHIDAEDMTLQENHYDLIIIMGSLEHVFDPNVVLKKCRSACKHESLLVLEGRFTPHNISKNYFNHNHHRYLRRVPIQQVMIKHGWKPFIVTDQPICGNKTGRDGNGYCIGKAGNIPTPAELFALIEGGLKISPSEIINEFDLLDSKCN